MARARIIGASLGAVALLATASVLALEVILAQGLWESTSPARIAAVVASAFEIIMLILLIILFAKCVGTGIEFGIRRSNGVWFALGLVAGVLATTASVVTLVMMGGLEGMPEMILQTPLTNWRVGTSVALVCAFVGQLVFIVVYFVTHRLPDSEQALSLHTNEDSSRHLPRHIKSIPYDRTVPATSQTTIGKRTFDYPTPPGSSGGRSVAETMSSIRTSVSQAVRPIGASTRLLSSTSRPGRRAASIDSNGYRERVSVNGSEDGFDSWDTSSVDTQSRQLIVEASPPIRSGRFLETIPASPTTSRSPSPGNALDFEPPNPNRNRRSRSYSPIPRPHHERSMTPQSISGELHIHPLFRSDSPVPPPAVTPGTVVVAAPNAGQVISEKSLSRMRSSSQIAGPSPLSRQGSYDSFRKTPSPNTDRLRVEDLAEERKMTPPIPDWILNAGSTTSLSDYQSKKQREREVSEEASSID
ncbi:uncharacterized protein F4812DRAFT_251924 [Daldinia caldariorum]|uniref:uncharacterized protein n=1 Tax=Daldinia caldariorum TaxID=326644 RepID=UPI0020087D6E|nr:uncharacterized protein F4812DRAFT_251924 [Daldinia caldariorum]KAI1463336.1 hypothetical protein F4812DRAFT_251924 [Daldinia caldariorum]